MKRTITIAVALVIVCCVVSCRTRKGIRKDDPYLYRRGVWNFSKGGLIDDVPQYFFQMLESMFDYGQQPVDPPSEYAPEDSYAVYAEEWVPAYGNAIGVPDPQSGISAVEEKALGY